MRTSDTRSLVFDLVRAAGQVSRAGLAERTGLTAATISTTVRQLLADGLVAESGRAPSTGGKPRTFVSVVPEARFAVGIQVGHSGAVLVVTDLTGSVLAMTRRQTGADPGTAEFVDRLTEEFDEILLAAGLSRSDVVGAGVGLSGLIDRRQISGRQQDYRGHRPAGLRGDLERALGVPVVVDNDATAAALGEWWVSSAGQTEDAVVVYLGAGIGAGLLMEGQVVQGGSGNAGELGHVCVDVHGPCCVCGAQGCVEAVAGPWAVVEAAISRPALARAAGLGAEVGTHGSVEADFAAVARAARRGLPEAERLLTESARVLAVAVRSVVNVVDADAVVLTGPSIAVAAPIYLPVIASEIRTMSYARTIHEVAVRLSPNGSTAAAIGAAALALYEDIRSPVAP